MADDAIEAILFDSSANRNQAQLNISLTVTIAVCIVFLFLSMSFGETLSDEGNVEKAEEWWDVPLNERQCNSAHFDFQSLVIAFSAA